jgi:hypothetical protein
VTWSNPLPSRHDVMIIRGNPELVVDP